MTITPGEKGAGRAAGKDLEQASDTPSLGLMKDAVVSVQDASRNYYDRNTTAFQWWRAMWPGQTTDGRRWATRDEDNDVIWPWPGSSDTRIRLCERLVRDVSTVGRYALMNAKVQAKSARPVASMRESQQATQLLNWMLYTHCAQEIHREQDLMLAWRHGFGAAVTAVEWDQERRLDYIPISMMGLAEFVRQIGENLMSDQPSYNSKSDKSNDRAVAMQFMMQIAQTPHPLLELSDMIMDPAYEADLARVLQAMSPVVTTAKAKSILNELRNLRETKVPVPYVFKSRPRRTTLRPMVDVLFPELTSDLQLAAFVDRVEFVRPTTLEDRIETMGYDPGFVEQAKKIRGPSRSAGFGDRYAGMRQGLPAIVGPGGQGYTSYGTGRRAGENEWMDDIELHHFDVLMQDKGVPILFTTTFHMDLEDYAKHAPCEYEHGEMIVHAHRNETDDRPILSSRGIPEIAYTWEFELKKQRDGRVDRTDMVLRPPIFTTAYEEVQKFKVAYMPGALVPMRRFDTIEKDKPPQWDPGSLEIDKTIMATVWEYFWGSENDPGMAQLRKQEIMDAILAEEKPIAMQTWQLIQQYLPPSTVAKVVGQLQRPFPVDRADIQGQFDITMTADARELDPDFLKQAFGFIAQLASLDTVGVLDRAKLVKVGANLVSYELADEVVQDAEPATQQEQMDEMDAFSKIVGSGIPQPLPPTGNFQLRKGVLENLIQSNIQSNPDFAKRLQLFPGTGQALQQRQQYFDRQLQQQQNAQIGRAQVADPFTKQAPQIEDVQAMLK